MPLTPAPCSVLYVCSLNIHQSAHGRPHRRCGFVAPSAVSLSHSRRPCGQRCTFLSVTSSPPFRNPQGPSSMAPEGEDRSARRTPFATDWKHHGAQGEGPTGFLAVALDLSTRSPPLSMCPPPPPPPPPPRPALAPVPSSPQSSNGILRGCAGARPPRQHTLGLGEEKQTEHVDCISRSCDPPPFRARPLPLC